MKHRQWFVITSVTLIALSAALYGAHYLLFHDYHHIFIYLVGDIAFIPLEVLLVVVVIERLLARHERRNKLDKMNMLVGTFFSEIGTDLLGRLTEGLTNKTEVCRQIAVDAKWKPRQYNQAFHATASLDYRFDTPRLKMDALCDCLAHNRDFLILLLANPNLLEHDRFTNLLWAVFHLQEEMAARKSLKDLPDTDLLHLVGDIRRVYVELATEWLHYCQHLQVAYPYIFSIVMRTHPLQDSPDATVT